MGSFLGGGGSTTTTETEQDTRLSEELRASSLTGLEVQRICTTQVLKVFIKGHSLLMKTL